MLTPEWRKSTYSNGNGGNNCVEVKFKKSSYSGPNGNCVEVAGVEDSVIVRDSKDREGPALTFTVDEWKAFMSGAKDGEFDL